MLKLTLLVWLFVLSVTAPLAAQSNARLATALAGKVSSEAEPAMEGVLVRAKSAGSPVSITVVTNRNGEYSFPASRLSPRTYNLDIRAVGYDLDIPVVVEVTSGETAHADVKLVPTKNLSAQLTSAEWLLSIPGTEEQKSQLF